MLGKELGITRTWIEHPQAWACQQSEQRFLLLGAERALPDDATREPPFAQLPQSLSGQYVVELDLRKVHDFILPPAALPFWDISEAEQWLMRCGFGR